MAEAVSRNFIVSKPLNIDSLYDVVLEKNNVFTTVQIKYVGTVYTATDNHVTYSLRAQDKDTYGKYNQLDIIAFYISDLKKWFFCKSAIFKKRMRMTIDASAKFDNWEIFSK